LTIRKSARITVAAAALAAGFLAAAGPAALAAPAAGQRVPGVPDEPCAKWGKTHAFVWIRQATGSARAGLTVTGKAVSVKCGGPDDLRYIVTSKPFAGHLLPSARVTVLSDANGVTFPVMAEYGFPRWVRHDHFGNLYAVTGPFTAIRDLNEEYHP
jgi:hypothetical protein